MLVLVLDKEKQRERDRVRHGNGSTSRQYTYNSVTITSTFSILILGDVSWMDCLTSVAGFMMIFAVVQNISVEFINTRYGEIFASKCDVT